MGTNFKKLKIMIKMYKKLSRKGYMKKNRNGGVQELCADYYYNINMVSAFLVGSASTYNIPFFHCTSQTAYMYDLVRNH